MTTSTDKLLAEARELSITATGKEDWEYMARWLARRVAELEPGMTYGFTRRWRMLAVVEPKPQNKNGDAL